MTTVHTIRISGFWTVTELRPGWVRYSRNFGQPRANDPTECPWLVLARVPGNGTVSVNGHLLANCIAGEPLEVRLTDLQPRNVVCFDLQTTLNDPLGEVVVEIRK